MFGNKSHPTDQSREKALQASNERLENTIKEMKEEENRVRRAHKIEVEDTERKHNFEIEDIRRECTNQVDSLNQAQKLALEEKEFEMKHYRDEELKKAREELTEAQMKQAVTENENKMLRELVKVSSDIIDIKDLVKDVINKLPTVNITSSIGGAPSKGGKQE